MKKIKALAPQPKVYDGMFKGWLLVQKIFINK